jgi:hypothetical protein
MHIPTIRGTIDRRILVNFRVDPKVLSGILPSPFRPQLVNGYGIAGICLIRLKNIRTRFLPRFVGFSSENAAHRIAVEWDDDGEQRTGVFIPRRDTSSLVNVVAGGRVFPGIHHHARFAVREDSNCFHIEMDSRDRSTHVLVDGHIASGLPVNSVFPSVSDVSKFFQAGSLGYSPDSSNRHFDGLELRSFDWNVDPLAINHVESSYFEDHTVFPVGSVEFDCALLMREIVHEWHSRESLQCSEIGAGARII